MTREEAIKQLKDDRVLCINSETEPFAIAYDMAIKALEQEPSEDCISCREKTCDYIAEFVNNDYSTQYECEMVDAMIEGIQHLPSVNPQEQYYKDLAESYEKTINKLTKAIAEQKTGQRINLKEFEEGIFRGCDYAGTQEVVHEAFLECIHDIGCEGDWDEMTAIDLNDKEIVLQDLMERFYDKVARNIVNYAKTCEVSE